MIPVFTIAAQAHDHLIQGIEDQVQNVNISEQYLVTTDGIATLVELELNGLEKRQVIYIGND